MTTELLHFEALPVLQNRVYDSRGDALASPTGDMVLIQDGTTGLVRNSAFDPALLRYDASYQNEQAHSETFVRHLDEVLAILARHFPGRSMIEVGCGKGYFLEKMLKAGYVVSGFDPAYEGNSPHVFKRPFDPGVGLSADVIVLRHVLEHVQDPLAFLASIAAANGGQGRIYIEVPCFDWIVARRAWFDIFYEHVNYFRASDFARMFGAIQETGHFFGGQYLYVIADLASLRPQLAIPFEPARLPADFMADVGKCARAARAREGEPRAIWGGSSKGVIFAQRLRREGVEFDAAIDLNPAKQGRFLPVSGLEVVSPESAKQRFPQGSLVFVMNSNYFDEIVEQSDNRFTYVKVDQHEL
jgi:SAM-dependent methyltransferase